jgi:Tfp pilus assembly protein PilP
MNSMLSRTIQRILAAGTVAMLAVFLAGCGGGKAQQAAEAQRKAEEKIAEMKKQKAPAAPPAEEKSTEIRLANAPTAAPAETGTPYQYDPINKPDPFRPFNPAAELSTKATENPLLKYEIRYFKLVGVLRDAENPSAIFEDPAGKAYTVHVGDAMGKNGGVVRAILEDAVIVTETRLSWRSEGTETVEMTIRLRPEDKEQSSS